MIEFIFVIVCVILVMLLFSELNKIKKKLTILDNRMSKRIKKRLGKSYLTEEDIDKQRDALSDYPFHKVSRRIFK